MTIVMELKKSSYGNLETTEGDEIQRYEFYYMWYVNRKLY